MNAINGAVTWDPGEDLRYERKFFIDRASAREVKFMIKVYPAVFRKLHPPRLVNNIYLESPRMACYQDNIDGISPRAKYRVRWYGETTQKKAAAVLEIKRKANLVGDKLRLPLGSWDATEPIYNSTVAQLVKSGTGEATGPLANRRCILANCYRRSYFQSADGGFRLTLDEDVVFRAFRRDRLDERRVVREPATIVEIKYPLANDSRADAVSGYFPFRVARISKYVRGVDLLRQNFLL